MSGDHADANLRYSGGQLWLGSKMYTGLRSRPARWPMVRSITSLFVEVTKTASCQRSTVGTTNFTVLDDPVGAMTASEVYFGVAIAGPALPSSRPSRIRPRNESPERN